MGGLAARAGPVRGGEAGVAARTSGHRGGRGGVSLLEGVVALTAGLLLLHLSLQVLVGHRRAVAEFVRRSDALTTVRVARWVVSEDLGRLPPEWAAREVGGDSSALRVVRATARVCGRRADGALEVAWSGARAPDATKDSVLMVDRLGVWRVAALVETVPLAVAAPGCSGAGGRQRWILDPGPPDGVVAQVFERGSYHLADGALRYRRGRSGRQPLTPSVLDERARFAETPGGGVTVELFLGGGHRPWRVGPVR